MSQALAANSLPESILPGMGLGLGFMAGMAVVGGLIGVAATSKRQSSAWLYGGVGSGIVIGGTVGYFGGRFIVKRSIEKLQAQAQEDREKRLAAEGAATS